MASPAGVALPRAGTFIYHTHMNDIEQLTAGLYGALIVLEPGQRLDPITDHLFIFGNDGSKLPVQFLLNGDSTPPPLVLRAGVAHRLRLINIGINRLLRFTITRDSVPVHWAPIAKDGADLPPARTTPRAAVARVDVGETYDFRWQPAPGTYLLTTTRLVASTANTITQQLVVR